MVDPLHPQIQLLLLFIALPRERCLAAAKPQTERTTSGSQWRRRDSTRGNSSAAPEDRVGRSGYGHAPT